MPTAIKKKGQRLAHRGRADKMQDAAFAKKSVDRRLKAQNSGLLNITN